MNNIVEKILNDIQAQNFISDSVAKHAASSIASHYSTATMQESPENLTRLALIYESQALELYFRNESSEKYKVFFTNAYECWKSLAFYKKNGNRNGFLENDGLEIFKSDMQYLDLDPKYLLALHLAVTGIACGEVANTRLYLKNLNIEKTQEGNWRQTVLANIINAFILLCRKSNGWNDIILAGELVETLRNWQSEFETTYLNNFEEKTLYSEGLNLIAFYHLAQLITITSSYLKDGFPFYNKFKIKLDKHSNQSRKILEETNNPIMLYLVNLISVGANELARNSIWSHVTHLGKNVSKLVKLITDENQSNPVIELWPSQQEAFSKNFFDIYKKAIIVEMPTSAGKTLLAIFSIAQTIALNPDGLIVYVVPTRALVNQITKDLRAVFSGMGFTVEMAIPSYELNPTESQLLSEKPTILVSTPEKLDLLIKSSHPSVDEISLLISDEAHNIGEESSRGSRLELLLGMIQREKPEVRFLLLSPFMPNGEEIVSWLGGSKALPPIKVNWKPNKKLLGLIFSKGIKSKRYMYFETLPALDNYFIKNGKSLTFPIGKKSSSNDINKISTQAVMNLHSEGAILVLCRGRKTSEVRAQQIASELSPINRNELLDASIRFISDEIGNHTILSSLLEKGVAFHHSGMSHETRWLVERLITQGCVKIICGTTTLAQGMNFPIKTVIFETLTKGNSGKSLSFEEFWNISGRAGRALFDTLGIICFPFKGKNKKGELQKYLAGEAKAISSYLAKQIAKIDSTSIKFNLDTVRKWPELAELMRYLAHAMRVSGSSALADEIEDVLRGSFAYYHLEKNQKKLASQFLELCNMYLRDLDTKNKSLLSLADNTGFSTPSVSLLLSELSSKKYNLSNPDDWKPSNLFGYDLNPLKNRIDIISDLPEMQLGDGSYGEFSSERIALILTDWVQGQSLEAMAAKYDKNTTLNIDDKISNFSKYLFGTLIGKASWGLGALEGICLNKNELSLDADYNYLSSMVFFGVKSKEAVWFRMAGVPRVFAEGLGNLWKGSNSNMPSSYIKLRQWVSALEYNDWEKIIPKKSKLTPKDSMLLWKEFSGLV